MTEQQTAAMQQALEALEHIDYEDNDRDFLFPYQCIMLDNAITALRQALEQEPANDWNNGVPPLYPQPKEGETFVVSYEQQPADGTQVSKVWWDGEKLMAKPIPLSEFYKEPEQQPADEPVAYRSRLESGSYTYCNTPQFFDNAEALYTRPQPAARQVVYSKPDTDHMRLIAAAPDLLEALQAYEAAQAMPIYGDYSDFVWPKSEMRKPGETAWGWICEKHGLGYQSGCICCREDFSRYKDEEDRDARWARDDALKAARDKARAAIAKATGGEV